MKHNEGKIYGFVGVIGSGKSYKMDKFIGANHDAPAIVCDFSDGIRDFLMYLFTGEKIKIDTNSEQYRNWKLDTVEYPIPHLSLQASKVNGRQLMERVGEEMKNIAGQDVWANIAANNVLSKWLNLPDVEGKACNIFFGSVRYDYEAKVLFDLGRHIKKDVEIIFCNFHRSSEYEIRNHSSEKFAQWFLCEHNAMDGDIITDLVFEKINANEKVSEIS